MFAGLLSLLLLVFVLRHCLPHLVFLVCDQMPQYLTPHPLQDEIALRLGELMVAIVILVVLLLLARNSII